MSSDSTSKFSCSRSRETSGTCASARTLSSPATTTSRLTPNWEVLSDGIAPQFIPTRVILAASIVGIVALALGCSGRPSRLKAPKFDADGAAESALSLYDTSGDGQLDEDELKACPALDRAMEEIDTNGDGILDQAEIEERIAFIAGTKTARTALACRVVKNGRPIVGATVRFVPEEFMGGIISEASGQTNESGRATIHIQDQMGGVTPGFYRVEISRKSSSGKESINKKYNTETTLGQEITDGSNALAAGLVFELR